MNDLWLAIKKYSICSASQIIRRNVLNEITGMIPNPEITLCSKALEKGEYGWMKSNLFLVISHFP